MQWQCQTLPAKGAMLPTRTQREGQATLLGEGRSAVKLKKFLQLVTVTTV